MSIQCKDLELFHKYLKRLCRSIRVEDNFEDSIEEEYIYDIDAIDLINRFTSSPGYLGSRDGYSWESRVDKWFKDGNTLLLRKRANDRLTLVSTKTCPDMTTKYIVKYFDVIPLFKFREIDGRYLFSEEAQDLPDSICDNVKYNQDTQNFFVNNSTVASATILQQPTENSKMKSVKSIVSNLTNQNKDAALIAAKLSAGKAGNTFLQKKLQKALPWYARLFSKKSDADNPVAKLVTANIVVAASSALTDNEKLAYVADAMLQDAMVSMTRDSDLLDNLVNQLTDAVKIPDELLKAKSE